MPQGIGDLFQQQTKYYRDQMSSRALDWSSKPPLYKEYSRAERIELPKFEIHASMPLHEILMNRKSIRRFKERPLTLQQLSYLLWASTGIQRTEDGFDFRTSPSAGALYPIETYLVVNNVNDLERGVYHYAIKQHALEVIGFGDHREKVRLAALFQEMCFHAPVVFIWTAVFFRSIWKYEQRAFRYVYLDAGHIAANLALSSTALGLGSCQIAALFDDEVNAIIEVDGYDESTLYMSVVGVPE